MAESRRSCCPVACALDMVGDKWTLLVVRDLAGGKHLFKEFMDSPERIASNILADRLRRLVKMGCVVSTPHPDYADRPVYSLTKSGQSLISLLDAVADWGLKNIPGTAAKLRPRKGD